MKKTGISIPIGNIEIEMPINKEGMVDLRVLDAMYEAAKAQGLAEGKLPPLEWLKAQELGPTVEGERTDKKDDA